MGENVAPDPHPLDIVIAGGGTAGWIAAATFARFLGNRATITLVESEDIGSVGVGEATIPQIHNLLIGLGLDQAEFLRDTNATFKLGIEFVDWRRRGERYIHSFGTTGRGVGLIPFRQLWLRGRALGVAADYGAYSANVAAARAGRFSAEGGAAALPYAYHFDATLLAATLRRYAEAGGVRRIEGRIETVERHPETGDVVALRLAGERRVGGSFFVDCTGFRSMLLGHALGVPFVDWQHWLPCDSAWAVPGGASPTLRPYTQSIALAAGWQWRIPLQHRTGNGYVFCSSFVGADEASAVLLRNLEGRSLADPRLIRFVTGHRRAFWSNNCVALGLAAGFMEPLESTSIHLVQSALGRLLSLLGNRSADLAEARATFNRLSTIEWERIRDFLVLHYILNERIGEPFWDHCRNIEMPATLAAKRDLFAEAGAFVREEDELFLDDSWSQVMIGQGLTPRAWSPLADNVPAGDVGPFLTAVADRARTGAASLPGHREVVEQMLARVRTH